MSHPFLYVWDANQLGLPNGIEDVPQLLEKAEIENPPSSALKNFIEQLQGLALYNKALKLDAVAPYLQLVAQTAHHSYPVVALEQADVPEAQFLAVLAQIVTIACQLNIVIYDDNRLILFLPSGRILPSQRAAWWIGALDYLDDKESVKDIDEVIQEVESLVTDLWLRHPDYQKHELKINEYKEWTCKYKKETSIGIQYIHIHICMDRKEFSVSAGINIVSPIIENICKESGRDKPRKTLVVSLIHDETLREELVKLTGCQAFTGITEKSQIAKQLTYIEQAGFTLLKYMEDIQGLDQLLNSTTIINSIMEERHHFTQTTWLPLIVARLANNPHFEAIAQQLATPAGLSKLSTEKQQEYQQQHNKLVSYLRDHVKPLV
ncbi:MAG: hypothetical protein I8H92_10780 [Moraxellaceae bacterium]|nr:hypothetical protein [Moraxellaceae bacterium]